jgi:hypothetical protein
VLVYTMLLITHRSKFLSYLKRNHLPVNEVEFLNLGKKTSPIVKGTLQLVGDYTSHQNLENLKRWSFDLEKEKSHLKGIVIGPTSRFDRKANDCFERIIKSHASTIVVGVRI